jgi:hypothetical protein
MEFGEMALIASDNFGAGVSKGSEKTLVKTNVRLFLTKLGKGTNK